MKHKSNKSSLYGKMTKPGYQLGGGAAGTSGLVWDTKTGTFIKNPSLTPPTGGFQFGSQTGLTTPTLSPQFTKPAVAPNLAATTIKTTAPNIANAAALATTGAVTKTSEEIAKELAAKTAADTASKAASSAAIGGGVGALAGTAISALDKDKDYQATAALAPLAGTLAVQTGGLSVAALGLVAGGETVAKVIKDKKEREDSQAAMLAEQSKVKESIYTQQGGYMPDITPGTFGAKHGGKISLYDMAFNNSNNYSPNTADANYEATLDGTGYKHGGNKSMAKHHNLSQKEYDKKAGYQLGGESAKLEYNKQSGTIPTTIPSVPDFKYNFGQTMPKPHTLGQPPVDRFGGDATKLKWFDKHLSRKEKAKEYAVAGVPALIGAIGGMPLGPAGMVGGAAVGAGVGYLRIKKDIEHIENRMNINPFTGKDKGGYGYNLGGQYGLTPNIGTPKSDSIGLKIKTDKSLFVVPAANLALGKKMFPEFANKKISSDHITAKTEGDIAVSEDELVVPDELANARMGGAFNKEMMLSPDSPHNKEYQPVAKDGGSLYSKMHKRGYQKGGGFDIDKSKRYAEIYGKSEYLSDEERFLRQEPVTIKSKFNYKPTQFTERQPLLLNQFTERGRLFDDQTLLTDAEREDFRNKFQTKSLLPSHIPFTPSAGFPKGKTLEQDSLLTDDEREAFAEAMKKKPYARGTMYEDPRPDMPPEKQAVVGETADETPLTAEQKLEQNYNRYFGASAGLGVGTTIWNLMQKYPDMPKPTAFSPDIQEMNFGRISAEMERARVQAAATARYDARQLGGGQLALASARIGAQDLESSVKGAAMIGEMQEKDKVRVAGERNIAKGINVQAENEWARADAAARLGFRAQKGQAVGQSLASLMGTGAQALRVQANVAADSKSDRDFAETLAASDASVDANTSILAKDKEAVKASKRLDIQKERGASGQARIPFWMMQRNANMDFGQDNPNR